MVASILEMRRIRLQVVRVRSQLNKWRFTETSYKFTDLKSVMKANPALTPLTFEPVFMERVWGGRRLESEFGKKLPPQKPIGESWEIADRPEAQSIVRNGTLRGKPLHELWTQHRDEIFRRRCPTLHVFRCY